MNDYDDSLLIIKKDKIEIVKNNIKVVEHKINIKESFYLVKRKILLIINAQIQGIKINDNNEIIYLFKFSQDFDYIISNSIFVKENYLKENEICELYEYQTNLNIFSFLIIDNTKTEQNSNEQEDKKIVVKNIKKNICDIPLIIAKDNNDPFNSSYNPREKNYFGIESIKNELIAVKKRSFLDRKEKVVKNIEQIKNINDIKQKYISLLCLIINDNTNTELLKEYLDFMNKNKDELKNIFKGYFEDFQNELDYFSKAFIVEENIFNLKTKEKSQKEEFNDFMEGISKLDKDNDNDIDKFENNLIGYDTYFKNISYFNMPIDFSNEQLFYYRNINIIKYHLKYLYDEIKDDIKSKIDKIKDNDNEKIEQIKKSKKKSLKNEVDKISTNIKICIQDLKNINDKKRINEIIISLIYSSNKEMFEFCYKYLMSPERNINNILQQNNYNFMSNLFNFKEKVNIDINMIKKFYKNILPLKCFKSIYLDLYGKDAYYPFDDKKFTDSFVEANFEVLDIPVLNTLGLTDKFTTKTYFIPFLSKIKNDNTFHYQNEDNIIRNGVFISTGNHEIGHNFTNFRFYMENCQISIETPRKKNLEQAEGGNYVDLALFGKVLKKVNLEQALYLLNEKNYEKTYLDFQYDFNNIKEEDLIVEGVFKEMCLDIRNNLNKDFQKIAKSIFISLESSSIQEKYCYCEIRNDVLGKKISDEAYKRMMEKLG